MKSFLEKYKVVVRAKSIALMIIGMVLIADGVFLASVMYMNGNTADGKSDVYAGCMLAVMFGLFLCFHMYKDFKKTFDMQVVL